ncbi:MAG: carboxypeptidase-like regulatory domain-containing protein [Leptospiraceae bacterium]|nr:carboxypeptidase-like regulatory domain-containing protein [Leptospiraceae bacterium]
MKKIILISLIIAMVNCKYPKADTGSSGFSLFSNISRGIGVSRSQVSCDADTPGVTTKKVSGRVRDFDSLANVADARITTTPATSVTVTDTDGTFTIQNIDSSLVELTFGITATGYSTLNEKISIGCQNTSATFLISTVTVSELGVDPVTLDNSKLDQTNIQ